MSVTDRIKKLATIKGYHRLWEKKVRAGCTHKEAYQKIESEYREKFAEPKYKNFESFRKSRAYLIKNHSLN